MTVREVMRPTPCVPPEAPLSAVLEAILASGSPAVPVVSDEVDGPCVLQLVRLRDLPALRRASEHAATEGERGVLELLRSIGRLPGRLPAVDRDSSVIDAWDLLGERLATELPVVDDARVVGIVSLSAGWSEFPSRSARVELS